jgi:hypothetical protein
MFDNFFFFRKSWRLSDNGEKYGRARQAKDDNIMWRMRIACWVSKATDTLRICNTYCFSTAAIFTRTRLKVAFIRTFMLIFPCAIL